MYLEFKNLEEVQCKVEKITNNLIKVYDNKVNLSGFNLYTDDKLFLGSYYDYVTLYKKDLDGFILSNDFSVYVEPKPIKPQIPTLAECKKYKKQEISNICNQVISNGIDVNTNSGVEHFSLTTEDQLNLFGKKVQLESNEFDKFEYHSDGHSCKYYSKEDMTRIVETALKFVSYQTTYCNSMFQWIDGLNTVDNINKIQYGDTIPKKYQSEVLKDYIKLMNVGV